MYGAPLTDLRFAVLLAPSHAGLPPAFIQVNEIDPIRDDGIVYEKALREAGVPTKFVLYVTVSMLHLPVYRSLTSEYTVTRVFPMAFITQRPRSPLPRRLIAMRVMG